MTGLAGVDGALGDSQAGAVAVYSARHQRSQAVNARTTGLAEPLNSTMPIDTSPLGSPMTRMPIDRWKCAALVFVFLWFAVGGSAHFWATEAEMRIVPAFVPWPRAAVLATGVLECLGALGLCWPRLRAAAGWGLFALTLAVTPANVVMLQHAGDYPVPYWALVLRLPLQVVLLALIAWSTAGSLRRQP